MKYKLLAIATLAVIIYSCKSSSTAVSANEAKPTATPAPATTSAPAAGPSVMTAELAEGKSLYDNNCAKCHRLYDAKDFSSEEWKPIVARMQKKSHLDDLQGEKIYNYLTMK